jgi:hypothetical protein
MTAKPKTEELAVEQFPDWASLEEFVSQIENHWSWLKDHNPVGEAETLARSNVLNTPRSLLSTFRTMQSQGQSPSAGFQQLKKAQTSPGKLVLPASERGDLLHDLRHNVSVTAGLFALSFRSGWVTLGQARNPDELIGALWTISPGFNGREDYRKHLQQERANLRQTIRSAVSETERAAADRVAEWNDLLAEARSTALKWSVARNRRLRVGHRLWQKRHADAAASISAVEDAYREQMGLKAPVEYWQTKAKIHQTSEKWARAWVLLFFPFALIGMAIAFNNTAVSLINAAQAAQNPGAAPFPTAVFIVASAGLASCAGLVFWVGRLLTKLYLSQHHLRQDAEERATMTQTYLALIENDAASTDDRQVILNALFRNTPDGIVKEDGGLDPSIAAALGKFLAKP